jgi:hypothetical protein
MTLSVPVVHVASRDHSLSYLHDPVSVPVVHVASRDHSLSYLHDPVSVPVVHVASRDFITCLYIDSYYRSSPIFRRN